ncbi:hypothetical protein [Leptospira sp. severe_002]|uniref:hypothetical protein n=1 Tax=Leptospira sp. severe_002 TaxID=2838237 RepID=UPI001E3B2B0D|nr:hypothetical protein [Leptospira sp. severe_002]
MIAAAIALATATPAFAEISFPISVPQECMELAQREGVPTVLQNKYQATRAKVKLASLSGKDPLVRDCRAAVKRAAQSQEAMARAQEAMAR